MAATLKKEERLSGKKAIASLLTKGGWGHSGRLKYCVLKENGQEFNRILVCVPKKFFKRAVKRNLLKRRIREAYRTQKDSAANIGNDIMLLYNSAEIAEYAQIRRDVAAILEKL